MDTENCCEYEQGVGQMFKDLLLSWEALEGL